MTLADTLTTLTVYTIIVGPPLGAVALGWALFWRPPK